MTSRSGVTRNTREPTKSQQSSKIQTPMSRSSRLTNVIRAGRPGLASDNNNAHTDAKQAIRNHRRKNDLDVEGYGSDDIAIDDMIGTPKLLRERVLDFEKTTTSFNASSTNRWSNSQISPAPVHSWFHDRKIVRSTETLSTTTPSRPCYDTSRTTKCYFSPTKKLFCPDSLLTNLHCAELIHVYFSDFYYRVFHGHRQNR